MIKAFYINALQVLFVLTALVLCFAQAVQAADQPAPAPQKFEAISGDWIVDAEATAEVYSVPPDLARNLDGLTISFDLKNKRLVAVWADGNRVSHNYQLMDSGPGAASLHPDGKAVLGSDGKAVLIIDGKHEVRLDFAQADRLVLTENGNSLVFKRAAAKAVTKPAVKP